jgi:hypothetical protein
LRLINSATKASAVAVSPALIAAANCKLF